MADSVLVAGGMMGGIFLLTAVFDPFLNYFEPRGLLYLGYAILFVVFGALGALGLFIFFRNQAKLRWEIRVPRLVFAFSVPPLFLLFHSLVIAWWWPEIIQRKVTLQDVGRTASWVLIVAFVILYAGVVKAAARWPSRATIIALWFNVGMGAIGVTAKFLKLFAHR